LDFFDGKAAKGKVFYVLTASCWNGCVAEWKFDSRSEFLKSHRGLCFPSVSAVNGCKHRWIWVSQEKFPVVNCFELIAISENPFVMRHCLTEAVVQRVKFSLKKKNSCKMKIEVLCFSYIMCYFFVCCGSKVNFLPKILNLFMLHISMLVIVGCNILWLFWTIRYLSMYYFVWMSKWKIQMATSILFCY
jgi:hypothetical protein